MLKKMTMALMVGVVLVSSAVAMAANPPLDPSTQRKLDGLLSQISAAEKDIAKKQGNIKTMQKQAQDANAKAKKLQAEISKETIEKKKGEIKKLQTQEKDLQGKVKNQQAEVAKAQKEVARMRGEAAMIGGKQPPKK